MFMKSPSTDLIIILVVVLLIVGPKRLSGLARQLGEGVREFGDSISGDSKDKEAGSRPELTSASVSDTGPTGVSAQQSTEVSSQPRA
jgi:sec-independent protein translocase protein TatA